MHVQFDTNQFKSLAAHRLETTLGAPSAVFLPGHDETENDLLADHFTSEKAVKSEYDGTPGTVWEEIVGRDNDLWDCFVGNCVAASMLGCSQPGVINASPHKPRRIVQIPDHRMRS
jgi:phage terminase large subunit GpA-like protein